MTMPEATGASIQDLLAELKTLESDSKQLSKQIGHAKKTQSSDAETLIAQKKALHVEKIDPLKARIKALKKPPEPALSSSQDVQLKAPSAYTGHAENALSAVQLSLELRALENARECAEWDAFVEAHPMGNLYYQSAFLDSIRKSLGHRILLISARDKNTGALVAVLPLIEQKSRLFGHLWTSIALVNYGGVLANAKETEQALLEFAHTSAKTEGVKRLEVRGLYERPVNWAVSKEKASMWLPLPDSHNPDILLSSFKAKLRSQIKKGYTPHVRSESGGKSLLDDYYSVFSRNMRDLGTPVYGKSLFAGLLKDLGDKAKLVVIYYDDAPASAAFLIQNHDTMEIPWASTIREYNRHNLNMVLYWEVLKISCAAHCKVFDFGRSSIDASTYRFKKQWGAQPIQHYWYSVEPAEQNLPATPEANSSAANTQNPKFQLLIRIWQRLPVWLANLMGPHIVKYIP